MDVLPGRSREDVVMTGADQVTPAQAVIVQPPLAHEDISELPVQHRHGSRRVFDEEPHLGFASAEARHGLDPLRDVVHDEMQNCASGDFQRAGVDLDQSDLPRRHPVGEPVVVSPDGSRQLGCLEHLPLGENRDIGDSQRVKRRLAVAVEAGSRRIGFDNPTVGGIDQQLHRPVLLEDQAVVALSIESGRTVGGRVCSHLQPVNAGEFMRQPSRPYAGRSAENMGTPCPSGGGLGQPSGPRG